MHGPFGAPQNLLDPVVYLIGLMLAWPLLLYLPVHLVTRWLSRRTRR
nr:hypothetical protein [Halomonas elongata]